MDLYSFNAASHRDNRLGYSVANSKSAGKIESDRPTKPATIGDRMV
ncbi:hypothetical protein ACOKW7_15670 [Limnospira platensis CENA597]